MTDLGTHGESLLCDKYRELYWKHNELQIIATPPADELAAKIAETMAKIVNLLGYRPAA